MWTVSQINQINMITTIYLLILSALAFISFKQARKQKDMAITRRTILANQKLRSSFTPEYEARALARIKRDFSNYRLSAGIYYASVFAAGMTIINAIIN